MNDKSIAIGGDHAGFSLKELLKKHLESLGFKVEDFGTYTESSVDYPDYVHPLASAVANGEFERGVLICGSGQGVAITANKHNDVRAALCWSEEITRLARQHNDANILCLPARFVSEDIALKILNAYLETSFEGGRHQNRVNKINC